MTIVTGQPAAPAQGDGAGVPDLQDASEGATLASVPPPSPDAPISDPLLRPDSAPRDASGRPVRAPLGNSIRTLLVFVLLVAVGVAVWWWLLRPDDLTNQLGGREWVITEVDGQPATT